MNWIGQFVKAYLHWKARPIRQQFYKSLKNPYEAQDKVLKKILKLTSKTKLPDEVTTYENYVEGISWTKEACKFFELTSGSSGIRKKIPYTKSLLQGFENMFLLWADDILKNFEFETGKIFISFSPQLKSMGMQSDIEYLNPILQRILSPFFCVQPSAFKAENGQDFLRQLALALLSDKELEIISIWSPTYFLSLLEVMKSLKSTQDFQTQNALDTDNWNQIWPKLKLISTWADGSSEPRYHELQRQFSHVRMQPKGLLATEAAITIPLMGVSTGAVPLWTETYLEYIDTSGAIRSLLEMKAGEIGELIVSTTGGLLRYRIGDLIECTGRFLNSPTVRFLRRTGEVSDLVGEKLDSEILKRLLFENHWGYWTLIPIANKYTFLSDRPVCALKLDEKLKESYHYALARELQQLQPVEVFFQPQLKEKYYAFCESEGMQKGDIKDRLLWTNSKFYDYLMKQE